MYASESVAYRSLLTATPTRPEEEEEVGLEATRLLALEHALADVRRLLAHAGRIQSPHRADVRALAALAEELDIRVLRECSQAVGAKA